ncbi:MAG: glycosyltransferase family 2 protein [Bacteroidales bacterium]|nr:glycosyltransferase family 2 protein [Bacteroidales bacterium]
MENIIISFVILEYNSLNDVRNCIESIKCSLALHKYEIIVSSNSCYSNPIRKSIESEFRDSLWLFNERNGGFAYGMNRGLMKTTGKYVVIVNPDVLIISGMLDMLNFMDENIAVGAIGPRIVDNEGVLQDSCREYVSIHRFLIRNLTRIFSRKSLIYERDIDYAKVQTVDWLVGAFILVRRSALIDSNGLDERYFLFAEDMDWCTRIRLMGYEIVYFPKTIVNYKGSRSARKPGRFSIIFLKSHLRYWLKYGFFYGYPKRIEMSF